VRTVGGIHALQVELYEVVRWAGAWEYALTGSRRPEGQDESGERLPHTRRSGFPEWSNLARLHQGAGVRDSWISGDLSMNGDGAIRVRGMPARIRVDFGERCSDLWFCVSCGCCVD
jgi:hypothetical protein